MSEHVEEWTVGPYRCRIERPDIGPLRAFAWREGKADPVLTAMIATDQGGDMVDAARKYIGMGVDMLMRREREQQ